MYVQYNTGTVDVDIGPLYSAHQLDSHLLDIPSSYCVNAGASDDRAKKCCISDHYHHDVRRRFVIQTATTNMPCKYMVI